MAILLERNSHFTTTVAKLLSSDYKNFTIIQQYNFILKFFYRSQSTQIK